MKNLLYVFILIPLVSFSQNGITDHGMPTGYTNIQLRNKNAIAIDNLGNKWVAFRDIGLGQYDGSVWTVYNASNSGLPSNRINSIAFDSGNNAWIGTDSGLVKFDGVSWAVYTTSNSGIVGDNVLAVFVNGIQTWIGTTSGASVFNGSGFINYSVSNSGIAGDTVQCFTVEQNGNVWMGTSNRLSRLAGSTWTTFDTLNSGLTDQNILSLYAEASGNVWIGTKLGGVFKHYSGNISSLSVLYPTGAFTYPGAVYSIGKGPQGGVAFSQQGQLFELLNNKPHIYYLPFYVWGTGQYFAYDYSSQQFWLVNRLGVNAPGINLLEFNPQLYNGFGLGLTWDNYKYLDINQVKAGIMNRGDMHWNLNQGEYFVPKTSLNGSVFSSALWIGGLDGGGNLHQAAMTYRQTGCDYWPGPLDTTNGMTDTATALQYDRIWKIDRFKIEEFIYYFNNGWVQNGWYTPDPDILSWPARGSGNHTRNMAPFVDVNNNGNYDPLTGGDYPQIKGDQELYWIFNDNLALHTETGGAPLDIEVHASAYAFTCPTIADSLKTLNYTTFYNFRIFNRGINNYDSVYIGLYQDCDLGYYTDDYVGSRPQLNFAYAFNGDSLDGWSGYGYSYDPPISSQVILNGPLAYPNDGVDNDNDGMIDEPGEKNLMTSFLTYNNDFTPVGNPAFAEDFYNFSRARWKDSTHVTYGGYGYGGVTPTNFMYPDFPYDSAGWSEYTSGNTPSDKRILQGCGPFRLQSGADVELDYAIVFSRDTNLAWNSVPYYALCEQDVQRVTNWFNANNFPSCLPLNIGMQDAFVLDDLTIYPNPAGSVLYIDYKQKSLFPSVEVYDVTGKKVLSGVLENFGKNQLNINELVSGLYIIRIGDGDKAITKKFIKQ